MKLQRSISRRLGSKEYVKYQVIIPNNIVMQAEWNPGDYIEAKATKKGILLCKIEPPQESRRPDYEQFKAAIIHTLTLSPQGFPWSELRLKAGLSQLTPSPVWVRQMEDENTLERVREPTRSQVIWKLPEEHFRFRSRLTLNGWTEKNIK